MIDCQHQEEEAKLQILLEKLEESKKKIQKLKTESSEINEGTLLTRMTNFYENEHNPVVDFFAGQGDVPKLILTNLYNDDSEHIRTFCLTCKRCSFFVASTCKPVQYQEPLSDRNEYGQILRYHSDFEFLFEWEPVWLNLNKNGCRKKKTKKKQALDDFYSERHCASPHAGVYEPWRHAYHPPSSPEYPPSDLY